VSGDSVECEQVEDGLWQRVWTVADRTVAERKLDQWLTKPTDGFFAKMNRRVSVPITRSISMLPITPNMVSLFTLGVGFAAGAFYARGGYWNTLLAAVLSLWASILDGCDGEIARLKLLESDFGCWLETICDYLYYLFIFAGMAIGLSRSSGSASYLAWGGVLSFGAIATFIVAGRGRQKLAQGRPEQYLSIWHAKADSRRTNPILYFSRHMNFIVRRCFLPYALLVFAVLDATKLAFFLSAVGVNLVWMFALYSHCIFSAGSRRRSGILLTRSGMALEGTSESAVSERREFIFRISA
jgi:phosphatidylglycerophosphate synthase